MADQKMSRSMRRMLAVTETESKEFLLLPPRWYIPIVLDLLGDLFTGMSKATPYGPDLKWKSVHSAISYCIMTGGLFFPMAPHYNNLPSIVAAFSCLSSAV